MPLQAARKRKAGKRSLTRQLTGIAVQSTSTSVYVHHGLLEALAYAVLKGPVTRAPAKTTDGLSAFIFRRNITNLRLLNMRGLRSILRNSILMLMAITLAIWSLPLISQLVTLGSFSTPVAILALLGIVALLWRVSFRIHSVLQDTFSDTFIGEDSD